MSDFSFNATETCHKCGKSLSSSDEECDHNGQTIEKQVFRRIGEGRESIQGVECTPSYKWKALEEKLGDDWISYQWLGPKSSVNAMTHHWDSIEDIPHRAMAHQRREKWD